MAYQNTTAETRPELLAVVMEARDVDRKFVGDRLFPVHPVDTRVADFMKITLGTGGLLATEGSDALLRAPGTTYKATGRTQTKDSYKCLDRGIIEPVDDTNAQNVARFFDAEASSAKLCDRNMRIAYEQRIAARTFDNATFTAYNPLVNYTYANVATINFVEDMKALKRRVNMRGANANTLVLNQALWDLVKASALLRTYFFGSNGGGAQVTEEIIKAEFKLDQILVAEASYSTAKKGKTVADSDLAYIWPATFMFLGDVRGGAPEEGGCGRTFVLAPNAAELLVTETYRDEATRSDVVRVRQDTDEKVIDATCGVLLTTNSDL